jgi:branched-chain amino acid transport system ATP-binding protein
MTMEQTIGGKTEQKAIVLEANQVSRQFGGLVAVDQVSLAVQQGEIFGLIGPNGAGKTTFFNLVTGLIQPSSGMFKFRGKMLLGREPHVIAQMGIARTFQNIRLFGSLTALENVMIAQHLATRQTNVLPSILGLPKSRILEQKARERSLELLDLVGLVDRAQERACDFPYGDQRRLEIARALALNPQLLLLDEPAAGMNPTEKQQLSEFIRSIRSRFDLTILLIEHHVPLVMGLCDRIAVLHFGELIAMGDPAAVRQDPAVIEAYLGGEP